MKRRRHGIDSKIYNYLLQFASDWDEKEKPKSGYLLTRIVVNKEPFNLLRQPETGSCWVEDGIAYGIRFGSYSVWNKNKLPIMTGRLTHIRSSGYAERIEAIKARAEAATPGPWECCDAGPTELWMNDDVKYSKITRAMDAEFIAHAREDIPWLIEQVEKTKEGQETALRSYWYQVQQTERMQAVVDAVRKWQAVLVGHGNLVDVANSEQAVFNALMELDHE